MPIRSATPIGRLNLSRIGISDFGSFRHRHLAAQTLIAVLVDAVATAQDARLRHRAAGAAGRRATRPTSGRTCGAGKARPVGSDRARVVAFPAADADVRPGHVLVERQGAVAHEFQAGDQGAGDGCATAQRACRDRRPRSVAGTPPADRHRGSR